MDFAKADWGQVSTQLKNVDWTPMEGLDPTDSLSMFFTLVLPILEEVVPMKKLPRKKRSRPMMARRRRLLWKRLSKTKTKIKNASTINQLMKLLQDKTDMEHELAADYEAVNNMAEDEAVLRIKENPKAFFSFAKSRQKTKARIGPFLDPNTGKPNPSANFAAAELSKQYSSVFVEPRQSWAVHDVQGFFSEIPSENSLSDVEFTEDDIMKACGELKSFSAAGADGVPAAFLKDYKKQLKRPL